MLEISVAIYCVYQIVKSVLWMRRQLSWKARRVR